MQIYETFTSPILSTPTFVTLVRLKFNILSIRGVYFLWITFHWPIKKWIGRDKEEQLFRSTNTAQGAEKLPDIVV